MMRSAIVSVLAVLIMVACAPDKSNKKRPIRPVTALKNKPDVNKTGGKNDTSTQSSPTAVPGGGAATPISTQGPQDGSATQGQTIDEETLAKTKEAYDKYNEVREKTEELYTLVNIQLGLNYILDLTEDELERIDSEIVADSIIEMNKSVDSLLALETEQVRRLEFLGNAKVVTAEQMNERVTKIKKKIEALDAVKRSILARVAKDPDLSIAKPEESSTKKEESGTKDEGLKEDQGAGESGVISE